MADDDVGRAGEGRVEASEESGEAWVVARSEGVPGRAALRQLELHVRPGEELEAELAVDERQAGADGQVAFPADPEGTTESGAEIHGSNRVEGHGVGGRGGRWAAGGGDYGGNGM